MSRAEAPPRPTRRDPDTFPPFLFEAYRSTARRAPSHLPLQRPDSRPQRSGPGPLLGALVRPDADLTRNAGGSADAIGERIIVTGQVLDRDGAPVPGTLVEVWQANAAGRYAHDKDRHDAPLDPNFLGAGQCVTDDAGAYSFTTIRPGAYPWKNDPNAWRPAHIHFSVFGRTYSSRLVTQMYFPGDPLLELDPIVRAVPTDSARERLVARYAHDVTRPEWALGYRFDIVLAGSERTPFEVRPGRAGGSGVGRRRP